MIKSSEAIDVNYSFSSTCTLTGSIALPHPNKLQRARGFSSTRQIEVSRLFVFYLHLTQSEGGADQGKVGQALGEVAHHLAAFGVVFFGK